MANIYGFLSGDTLHLVLRSRRPDNTARTDDEEIDRVAGLDEAVLVCGDMYIILVLRLKNTVR